MLALLSLQEIPANSPDGDHESPQPRAPQLLSARNSELLTMLYHFMIKREIDRILTINCEGCQLDRPGQRAHMMMGTGCLQPWNEAVDLYVGQVTATIDAHLVLETYRRALEALNLPLPPVGIAVAAIEILLQKNPPRVLADTLKGPDNVSWDYRQVFATLLA